MQLNYYVLGQRIQKIRKNKRISQAVLSTMIDKSAGYISYLECGTKVMSLETFVGIANALEVSTDTLLNRQLRCLMPRRRKSSPTAPRMKPMSCWMY